MHAAATLMRRLVNVPLSSSGAPTWAVIKRFPELSFLIAGHQNIGKVCGYTNNIDWAINIDSDTFFRRMRLSSRIASEMVEHFSQSERPENNRIRNPLLPPPPVALTPTVRRLFLDLFAITGVSPWLLACKHAKSSGASLSLLRVKSSNLYGSIPRDWFRLR